MTGEGIHTAMISGKAAAITVAEMVDAKDYSLNAHAMYEKRWKYSFGHDFLLSSLFSKFIYRFPVLMDAVTNEMRRGGGDALMSKVRHPLEIHDLLSFIRKSKYKIFTSGNFLHII